MNKFVLVGCQPYELRGSSISIARTNFVLASRSPRRHQYQTLAQECSQRAGDSQQFSCSIFNLPILSLQLPHSFHILQASSLSPYYFNMFRRALTSLRTTSTKNNEISSLEASVVDEYIAELTDEIFELEDRKNIFRQYLYIVGLEIKRYLPPPTSEKSRQLSSFPSDPSASTKLFGDVDFVRTSVEELLKSCTPNSHPREIPQKNRRDSTTQCPSSMIERPERLAADRTISLPASLKRKYLLLKTARKPNRKVRLNWNVLKKTELEVEVDKLQSASKFWGSVYEQVEEFFSSSNREIESNQSRPGIKHVQP